MRYGSTLIHKVIDNKKLHHILYYNIKPEMNLVIHTH